MRKFLVVSVIFTLILTFASSLVYASGIDMNLNANIVSTGNTNTNTNTNTNEPDMTVYGSPAPVSPANTQSSSTFDTTVSVGSTAGISESSLSLSNILNIILIVLGILLVLFAIAILIRIH